MPWYWYTICWENTCTLHSGCCLTHISLGGFLWDPKGLVFPTCCSRSLRVISVLGLLPSCIWLVAHACSYANNKAIISACCLDKCVVMGGGCLQKGLGVFYCGVKWNTYVKVTTCHILYLEHILWVFVDYTNKLSYFESLMTQFTDAYMHHLTSVYKIRQNLVDHLWSVTTDMLIIFMSHSDSENLLPFSTWIWTVILSGLWV